MAGHAEHVRFAVVESALAYCPLPHVGCAVHDVPENGAWDWYDHAEHATHATLTAAVGLCVWLAPEPEPARRRRLAPPE